MTEAVILLAMEKMERFLAEKSQYLQSTAAQIRRLIKPVEMSVLSVEELEAWRMHRPLMALAEVVHDADIAIDTFISNVENSTRRPTPRKDSNSNDLDNFIKEMQSIETRIESLESDSEDFCGNPEAEELLKQFIEPKSIGEADPIRKEDVVGLEREVKLLLKEAVFQTTEEASTLCIVGMGGIGKTTLASLLYNNEQVVGSFEIRAWLSISTQSQEKGVLLDLMEVLRIDGERWQLVLLSADDLRARVFRRLEGRAYFIVLDDVWDHEYLEFLLDAFPREDNKSRLVITSRSKYNISTGFPEYIHEMEIMDPSTSWELFVKKVFTDHRQCPKHLKSIGKQIVKKCNGLPLALQEAGTKLSNKTESESAWQEFLETMDLSETSESLELSFNRLSARLKSCFVRLGFSKEATTLRVDKLVQIWIAGGMMSHPDKEDHTDEEIGRQDLEQLIGECLVQIKDMNRDNQVKNCVINYNLHRLAVTLAKREIMFEVLSEDGSNYQSSFKPRHRAICCSREMFSYSTYQDRHLVSLFFRGVGNFDASPSYWKSFELLKILDFEGFGLKALPEIIGTLTTLKYLGLRNNFLQELPCSLGQLGKLEVLDMAENFMVEVPNIIWEMDSLRHLYLSDVICREPLRIDKLRNLQTLTYISVDKWTHEVSGLKMMNNLRKLGIHELDGNTDVSKLFESLVELEKLEHLILRGCRFRSMPELHGLHVLRGLKQLKLDGLLTSLPSADNFPPNIEYLSMSNSCLNEDPMPILEKLSQLVYLKLRNAFIGEQMVISLYGFPELQILCIEELWHLRNLEFPKAAMEGLKKFEVINCPYLKIAE